MCDCLPGMWCECWDEPNCDGECLGPRRDLIELGNAVIMLIVLSPMIVALLALKFLGLI